MRRGPSFEGRSVRPFPSCKVLGRSAALASSGQVLGAPCRSSLHHCAWARTVALYPIPWILRIRLLSSVFGCGQFSCSAVVVPKLVVSSGGCSPTPAGASASSSSESEFGSESDSGQYRLLPAARRPCGLPRGLPPCPWPRSFQSASEARRTCPGGSTPGIQPRP